jgi:hypothetical protein
MKEKPQEISETSAIETGTIGIRVTQSIKKTHRKKSRQVVYESRYAKHE